jgi:hypothetical protein
MSTIVVDPYLADAERLFGRHLLELELGGRSRSERGNGLRLTTFLVVMSAASLAIGLGESLIPAVVLRVCGLTLSPIGASVIGLSATGLLGLGLAVCLSRKARGAVGRRCMFLAPFVATAIGTILACLFHAAGQMVTLTWLISPVYLLWAWGSAVCGR